LASHRPATFGSPALDQAFVVLGVLSLATIWAFRYPAGVDLPQHANIMRILADYNDPATGYAAFYERQFLTPYLVTYLVGLPFTKLFGALFGVKVILSIAALATPFTLTRWLQVQRGEPWWGLLGFPLTFGFGYHWGFLSFVFALPLVFVYLGAYQRLTQRLQARPAVVAALGALLLYLTHGIAFGVAMLVAAGQSAVQLARRWSWRAFWLTGAHFVPAFLASVAWQAKSHVPGIAAIEEWPPRLDRFEAFLSGELIRTPSYTAMAVGAVLLIVMVVATRPATAGAPARLVPFVVSALLFVLLPETVAGTWLVGTRMLVFVHLFGLGAFNPGVHGRRLTGARVAIAVVAFGCLVGHGVRMAIFNRELRGLSALIAAIPPHADVRSLVISTEHDSAAFGAMMGQTPAWITAANAGFLENDSGGYFQLPIQRPRGKPWITEYRWFVARGGPGTPTRVSGSMGPVRLVEHADDWWLFESQRPPAATGGLEVVRYAQEWRSLQVGRSLDGRPLRVGGQTFTTGFGTHAFSRIQVRVRANGQTLRGRVGIDDEAGGPTELVFTIRGIDCQLLYESPPITNNQVAVPFAVPLGGRRDLILSVEISPRCKDNKNAHADWLDLKVD